MVRFRIGVGLLLALLVLALGVQLGMAAAQKPVEEELKQEGGELYLLLDAETFEAWKAKLAPAGISDADIEKYLEANGTTTPVFAHGETLEEAAAAAGINADNLLDYLKFNKIIACGGSFMVKDDLVKEKKWDEMARIVSEQEKKIL